MSLKGVNVYCHIVRFVSDCNISRAAFVGFKADLKARHEMHCLKRWYQCNVFLGNPLSILVLIYKINTSSPKT